MEAIARTKYLKGSPRKARLVIDMIRGQNVSRALSILRFTEKRAAGPIAKCLSSAIANATYSAEQMNIAIDPDDLWIKTCFVDMGPHKNRRRVRPAPQGRAYREQRHYCHITIEVTSDEKPKTEKELKAEAGKARSAERVKANAGTKKSKSTKKAAAPKEQTKAEAEEPTVAAAAPDETAEAQVTETPAGENFEEAKADREAQVADAKDASTAEEAENKATKPADDAQVDEK